MPKVILVANCCERIIQDGDAHYIGVDKGALICLREGISMQCAIGDFDSIEEAEYNAIKKQTKVLRLPVMKNMVDSEYALTYAYEQGYTEIELQGVIGGRMDHFMVLYQLLKMGEIPFSMRDPYNHIYRLEKGCHTIEKKSTYLSFLVCEPTCITTQGVKYPLTSCFVEEKDVYLTSNEIIDTKASVCIDHRIIVIESNDKKKSS